MNDLPNLTPAKLKLMSVDELNSLASVIRDFLIDKIQLSGGHLGPNLGVVELTIALHYVFDSPKDQLIFDIGHQAYTHKIITSRAKGFDKLRASGGISGFTSYEESIHDVWESGHAGTSLSALMGFLYSNKIDKSNHRAVAVVGDGALSSGMSLEALNLISYHNLPGIIIINNNKMSISKSVGKLSEILNGSHQVKSDFFNNLGYEFTEVVDGHNLTALIETFKHAKKVYEPQVILVNTIKGKGLLAAEEDQVGKYHMIDNQTKIHMSWSEVVSNLILDIQEDIKTMVVVPAMEIGSHLTKFKEKYPNRFLDVGISEEHAATMSAALAKNNKNVILSLYSTFSQRAFDQILNDISRPNLGVFITIDRSGLIPGDGDTHQGIYDVSMFSMMPNITITMPSNIQDAADLLRYGLLLKKPFIMRFPKGEVIEKFEYQKRQIKRSWDQLTYGNKLNIVTYGPLARSLEILINKQNLNVNLYNAKFIKPLDFDKMTEIFNNGLPILVIEEIVNRSGLYQEILEFKEEGNYHSKVISHSLQDLKIPHLSNDEIRKFASFDLETIYEIIKYAFR
ncbi:MAG: 1-deoxy-D-xylulose-5-phosphate synthase [Acholeplasmataceae bacterium]|jgi:1-deoxy-D-xylulose-5-phosphate synthase